jgi:rhamnosyltransferase
VGAPANTSANIENARAGNGRRNNEYFFLNQRSEIIDCPTLTATVSQVTYQGENPTQTASNSLHLLAAEAQTPNRFWLVVPTYNPGLAEWAQWLQALKQQDCQPDHLVVVDSGSTDGSLALSEQAANPASPQSPGAPAVTLLHVQAAQFDHGGTRQWALNQALQAHPHNLPQVVVFMTQDAILAQPDALQKLVQAFQNPNVAAAFGRQLPKPQATWLEANFRQFNYPATSRTVQLQDKESLGLKACFFSNAFGAYRLSALQAQGGLPAGQALGEDTFMAAKLLLSGQSLQYQAQAAVYHSHQYNGLQDFQRMFDTGVFHAQNPWLLQSFGRAEGEGWRLLRHQWANLQLLASGKATTNPAPSKVPSLLGGLLQIVFTNVVKLCGYKLGQWHRYVPNALNKRLSMYKSFWRQQA